MLTPVNDKGLSADLVREDEHVVLEVEVYAEGLGVELDAPKLASLQGDLLALDFLKQIQMLGVELDGAHLSEDRVERGLVVGRHQEPVLVNVGVKLFDHLRLVLLKVLHAAHRDTQQHHLPRCDDLAHVASNSLKQGVVEKFVADADALALVECLEQVVETTLLKSGLQCRDLVLTRFLQLAKQRLNVLALLLTAFAEQAAEYVSFLGTAKPGTASRERLSHFETRLEHFNFN